MKRASFAIVVALMVVAGCGGTREALNLPGGDGAGRAELGDVAEGNEDLYEADEWATPDLPPPDVAKDSFEPPMDVTVDGTPDSVFDCCHSNQECGPGGYCVGGNIGAGGVCFYDLLEDGSCFEDADCGPGIACIGATLCSCDMNCLSQPGACENVPANCCFLDDDCPPEMVCASSPLGGGGPGTCEPALTVEGSCWDDEDCGPYGACIGATVCPCGELCGVMDAPGDCKPGLATDCCLQDSECGFGHECVLFPEWLGLEFGACKPILEAGSCWQHADCMASEICIGAVPCPCGMAPGDGCDIPGQCHDKQQYGCCTTDEDCNPEGCDEAGNCPYECGIGDVCVAQLTAGQCWTQEDCGLGMECVDVSICPCGLLCALPTSPGSCQPLNANCCFDDQECPPNQVCVGDQDGLWGEPGVCHEEAALFCPATELCCWEDDDCPGGSLCSGAQVCPCDADCDAPDFPGQCLYPPD